MRRLYSGAPIAAARYRQRVATIEHRSLADRRSSTAAGSTPTREQPFPSITPRPGEVVADVPRLGAAETRRAIEAAQRALPAWKARPARERARILRRLAGLMDERRDELAALMVTEQGKPLVEALAEVDYALSFYEWFGEEAKRLDGRVIPATWADKRVVVSREPIGVTAGIAPWNFPAAMPTRKSAPALAVGCTMVLKPAEQTPLSALAIAALASAGRCPRRCLLGRHGRW